MKYLDAKVTHNINDVRRRFADVIRRQTPFAVSRALNNMAFMGRKHIVNTVYPRSFQVRNRRFINAALRVKKASKRNLVAVLFDKLGREYLKRHAEGGVKTPRGSNIAIPSRELQGRRSGKGVPKRLRPRNAIGSGRAFVVRSRRSGRKLILERRRKTIRVLYLLKPQATIKKSFDFYEALTNLARRRFPVLLARSLRDALRTAR